MTEGVYVPHGGQHKEYASKGVAGTGLGLGIAGTALGLLSGGNGILGNLFGNNNHGCGTGYNAGNCCNPLDAHETKEAAWLRQENATLKAERYADTVAISAYKDMVGYVNTQIDKTNGVLKEVTATVIAQGQDTAVLKANIQCLDQKLNYEIKSVEENFKQAIALEGERRYSGDREITNWVKCAYIPAKKVIDRDDICPEVMPRYNSWTAPTEPAPAA